MKKVLSRGSLLKSDGKTLCEIGYCDKLVKSYNLKDIKGKGIDKFRENFELIYYESGFCFAVNVIRRRFFGEIKIQIFDFLNRHFEEERVVEFFACKKYSLSKERELHIKNSGISLDFVDGKKKTLNVKGSGDGLIKIDAEITNKIPLSVVTTGQFKDGFNYARNSIGYIARGTVKYGDRKIKLYGNDSAQVAYNYRISTTKLIKNNCQIFAEGKIKGKNISIVLDTLSGENCANSSIVFYEGYIYKLGEMVAVIRSDDGYKFLGKNNSFSIVFSPHALHFDNYKNNKGIEFGKLKGEMTLKNGDKIAFENIGAFIAYNSRIM